ncbi:hypothetical protein BN871_KA_00060 [Paenibacillus sp. P22]|nr:hypothetical protein BN871_KA_00060 [Paenibacillus sp. P22]
MEAQAAGDAASDSSAEQRRRIPPPMPLKNKKQSGSLASGLLFVLVS